ncbi:carboxypeptidase-like regulatory domain-containing protein [Gimesia aquarii]|uniref:Carboxypeptidase regulatory-like domain-containing protein n=1 Tax=Gimesia aquarii TaxID=2527964 RepID=A0A517VRM1_9PLAN|nr:carboxypeptidase-like regulatory domain-containing protein [Gimesia aquarii]QDT95668.1 hypothetical protein V144x_11150 [Gimesia aquarii]
MYINQLIWIVILSFITFTGCSGGQDIAKFKEGLVPVKGIINIDDQPVEGTQITFTPEEAGAARFAIGVTDETGKYQMMSPPGGPNIKPEDFPGVKPGKYRVTFSRFLLEDGSVWDSRNSEEGPMNVGAKETIPVKFTNANTTSFTADISPTGNEALDFRVKSMAKR